MNVTFGSVCSGIEAASVAWHPLGWRAAWLAEIEPFPAAILAHHYPDVPNLGDMTKLAAMIKAGEIEAPDVFCGGTPCQAFSVAGLRRSLDDARGNLSLTFCEIANELDTARSAAGRQPATIFWENVPGVLSTKDNAFGCFLAGLAGEDDPLSAPGGKWTNAGFVLGPQRAVAWRVLDAQYFGVAQRRRRVFVVASARKGFDPAAVLFEFDGVRRDSAPSREAGESPARGAAPCLDASFGRLQGCSGQDANHGHGHLIAFGDNNQSGPIDVATARNACSSASGRLDFDASEDGTGRGTPLVPVGTGVRYAYYSHDYAHDRLTDPSGVNPAITAEAHASGNLNVAVPVAFPANLSGTQCASTENVAPALGALNPTAVAFQPRHYSDRERMGGGPSDVCHTLSAAAGQGDSSPHVAHAMQVRRLTPIEAERLQGFPDGYTAIPWRGKPADQCPDGPRYKALGNSWAVPVVRWIGQRIDNELRRLSAGNDNQPAANAA